MTERIQYYYHVAYYAYVFTIFFASVCSFYRFNRLDPPAKVLSVLVCFALINEIAAWLVALRFRNNLPLYSIYCLFEYGMLCLYFNKVIDVFIRTNMGIYIGVAGIVLGVVNLIYIQHINTFNSYFLFFEGLSVIGMSLFAFFRLLLKEDVVLLYKYPHFWFITILVFFWSITFLSWGLYDYINLELLHAAWKINFALMIVGVITYSSFGGVFLFYPKKISLQ